MAAIQADDRGQRFGLRQRRNSGRQGGGRGRLEDQRERELDPELTTHARCQLSGHQGMTTELEEALVDVHLFDVEHLSHQSRHTLYDVLRRGRQFGEARRAEASQRFQRPFEVTLGDGVAPYFATRGFGQRGWTDQHQLVHGQLVRFGDLAAYGLGDLFTGQVASRIDFVHDH